MLSRLLHIMVPKDNLSYLFDTPGQMQEVALGQRQQQRIFLHPRPQAAFPRAMRIDPELKSQVLSLLTLSQPQGRQEAFRGERRALSETELLAWDGPTHHFMEVRGGSNLPEVPL